MKNNKLNLFALIILFLILAEVLLIGLVQLKKYKLKHELSLEESRAEQSIPVSAPPPAYSYGLDVSEFNSVTDWNKVRKSGIDYVIIRVGGRGYGSGALYTDEYAAKYLEGARRAGLRLGAYFYSSAISVEEAILEAYYALDFLNGMPLELPVYFDTEFAPGHEGRADALPSALQTDIALAFCQTVEASGDGYRAGVYSNYNYFLQNLEPERLSGYSLWVADYVSPSFVPTLVYNPTDFPYPYDIWQYTSSGRIQGISGRCDLNRMALPDE